MIFSFEKKLFYLLSVITICKVVLFPTVFSKSKCRLKSEILENYLDISFSTTERCTMNGFPHFSLFNGLIGLPRGGGSESVELSSMRPSSKGGRRRRDFPFSTWWIYQSGRERRRRKGLSKVGSYPVDFGTPLGTLLLRIVPREIQEEEEEEEEEVVECEYAPKWSCHKLNPSITYKIFDLKRSQCFIL